MKAQLRTDFAYALPFATKLVQLALLSIIVIILSSLSLRPSVFSMIYRFIDIS